MVESKVPKVVLFLESSRQYGRDVIRGIVQYSRLHGPWTFYREDVFYNQDKRRKKDLSWIKKWGANGIIARDFDYFDKLMELGIPTVIASAFIERNEELIEIITDNERIAQLAYEHFSRRGFKNFAFCGFNDMPWSKHREESFDVIVKSAGFKIDIFNSNSSRMLNWDKEHPRIIKWLKSLSKPVGILCCNDDRGSDLIEACKTGGLEVPFEVSVLGVDNDSQVCELSNPPLSSISLSTEKAGFEAASILDKLMSGKPVEVNKIMATPLEVVSRQSTDTLAVNESNIAKALQFINHSSKKLIQVSDVLNIVNCSRRSLDEKFQRYLGHTVFSEIRRARVENIAHLLLETDLSISQIAFNLGYNDSGHIARFFRQEKNMTPQAYRKQYAGRKTNGMVKRLVFDQVL
jgi:LacI family transcriptional regulator